MQRQFRLAVRVIVLTLSLSLPRGASAQSSAYVPNLDPAYLDVDALVAVGWITDVIAGELPYSRLKMARLTVQARAYAAEHRNAAPRFAEALRRLETAFAPEIASLCTGGSSGSRSGVRSCGAVTSLPHGWTLRTASVDGTLADSPGRPIPTSYDLGVRSYIDADLNPLLQKNQGRQLANGATLGGEFAADWDAGSWLAAAFSPRAWGAMPQGGSAGLDAALQDLYVRAVAGKVSVDVGRNRVALGYGPEAGPLMSHNARGYDGVRFSLEEPIHFPGALRALGPISGSLLVADMGHHTFTPGSILTVLDGTWRPSQYFEMGLSLVNHQGGSNSPSANLSERLKDLLQLHKYEPEISDKVIAGRARITIPALHAQGYTGVSVTDDHDWFRLYGLAFRGEAAWIVGLRLTGLGTDGRFDFWSEARRNGMRPFTHHQFRSGLTLDRRIIGDAMGPVAEGITGGVDWRGVRNKFGVSFAAEQYGGADLYGGAPWFFLERDNPDEVRDRLLFDWSVDAVPGRAGVSLHAGVEHVDHAAFQRDYRFNGVLQLKLDYRW